jgi:hypothetical protein
VHIATAIHWTLDGIVGISLARRPIRGCVEQASIARAGGSIARTTIIPLRRRSLGIHGNLGKKRGRAANIGFDWVFALRVCWTTSATEIPGIPTRIRAIARFLPWWSQVDAAKGRPSTGKGKKNQRSGEGLRALVQEPVTIRL